MNVPTGIGQTVVYEADSSLVQAVHQCREKIHHVCRQHMNKRVRVRTMGGQMFEGVIVGVDEHWLYLDTAGGLPRQPFVPYPPYYYNPYASTILPLALFDLLAIALII